MTTSLRRTTLKDLAPLRRTAVDPETLVQAARIVEDVQERGEPALREHGERLGDLAPGAPLVYDRATLEAARVGLDPQVWGVLERTAARIQSFAEAQLEAFGEIAVPVPGGFAGHMLDPVARAGCYAPGGRFPLPSSVLMTAVTARVAGVEDVWVASPNPSPVTLAAAAVAGADALLTVGGAQAIAALAFGAGPVPACDAIVGPGNQWVTAAKQLVAGHVSIDMLAGPSELVVLADGSADPETVAADLLAQAEHDPQATPILVTTGGEAFAARVDQALATQLAVLPTADTATPALENGFTVLAKTIEEAIEACDRLAPEHLEVLCEDADEVATRLSHWGALFVGAGSAEVFGDYGAGPNHVLPTGGTARSIGGLSVMAFLRVRTWLRLDTLEEGTHAIYDTDLDDPGILLDDAVRLARLEGLEGHARAALRRRR